MAGAASQAPWTAGFRRVVAHVDMDAFFAAVEVRERPELAGRPVIVGGQRDSRRGVVATCSYEARRFGVRSAMPIREAVRLCPHGVFLEGRMELYREVSRRIFGVLHRFSPHVEQVSVDEAYLDITADVPRFGSPEAMGRAIKQAVREAENLPCTVGIGPNKFLAKLATELAKPDGLRVLSPADADELLPSLPLRQLPGVGERTARRLQEMGLATVADVRARSRSELAGALGRAGEWLWQLAWGFDPRPVEEGSEARSVSAEQTFEEDVEDPYRWRRQLALLTSEVARRLREEGLRARSVTLKARYADFLTVTRRTTLPTPTADDGVLYETACRLLRRVPPRPGGLRLLGVAAGELTRFSQAELWEAHPGAGPGAGRQEKVARVMDALNRRFGRPVVIRGRLVEAEQAAESSAFGPEVR